MKRSMIRKDDYYGGDVWLESNEDGSVSLRWRAWGLYGSSEITLELEELATLVRVAEQVLVNHVPALVGSYVPENKRELGVWEDVT